MSDSDDLMLSGDEVVALLVAGKDGYYSPQLNTGIYFIRAGRVYAETGNPFRDAVDGKTLDEILAAAKAISAEIDVKPGAR